MSAPLSRASIRRVLAIGGLFCLYPLGRGLVAGTLTIPAAAQRAVILVAVLWLLEHIVVPVVLAAAFPTGGIDTPVGVGQPATINAPTDGSEGP